MVGRRRGEGRGRGREEEREEFPAGVMLPNHLKLHLQPSVKPVGSQPAPETHSLPNIGDSSLTARPQETC